MHITDFFSTHRCESEYSIAIPGGDSDSNITIHIAAQGGGTVGKEYAFNQWVYGVYQDGELIISGADISSTATPASHATMVRTLANFLANEGERLNSDYMGQWVEDIDQLKSGYSASKQEFLIHNRERFSQFAHETAT